jgi:DNA repair exonuclease SbcCD ATPase subunit
MTDISEVLSALKRGNMSIEEAINELNESLKTVKKGLNDLEKPIEEAIEFERRQKDEIAKYESSNLTLSQEISNLKEEKTSNENLLKETQDKYTETTDKRTKLETKKRDTTTELSNTEKKLETAKAEYEMEKETNLKITAELASLIQAAEQKINEIEKQAESERDLIRRTKGERMALEYLVKRNHIEFNELKIINSLEGRKSTDMATISKVTGLSDSLILKTLDGLMRRNLLTYDNSTGAITVTGNLKL